MTVIIRLFCQVCISYRKFKLVKEGGGWETYECQVCHTQQQFKTH